MKKKTFLLIGIATLLRAIAAMCVELGNDEVYYRMYAQDLQSNYFDHPPVIGWLIRVTTLNLLLDNEFFVRLGALISGMITTWIIFLCGKKLRDEYTGFLAALIYTSTIYGSIMTGLFILPDSPQMICWSGCLYLLIDIGENRSINKAKKKKILWFGVLAGLGMLCKIHTCFLWFGFILFIISRNRKWLRQPQPYISCFITLVFFYPVIRWNIDHHFVTYLYHSKRVDILSGSLNIDSFLTFNAGQVLYSNPVIFIYFIIGVVVAVKDRLPVNRSQKTVLLFCSLPIFIIPFFVSLFKDVLPHWSGPAYPGLALLTACYFSTCKKRNLAKRIIPIPLLIALGFTVIVSIGGILAIKFFPGTLGKHDLVRLGEGDPTLDMYGWKSVRAAFLKISKKDEGSGSIKKDAPIISNKWFTAAHLDYYVSMPLKRQFIAIGDTGDIHQYAWLNTKRKKLQPGDDAYCIVSSENYFSVMEAYSALFATIELADKIGQQRNGKLCRQVYIYRLKNYRGPYPIKI